MAPKTFYTVLIESTVDRNDSFVQVFWAWAENKGEAIARVADVARDHEKIVDPFPVQMDPYDVETLPEDVKEIDGTGVYSASARFFFQTSDLEEQIRPPAGVILSCWDGEYEPDELRAGFSSEVEEDGLFRLTIVPSQDDLKKTFLALVEALPSIRVSWVEFSHEWGDVQSQQLYANEALNTPHAIHDFLQREQLNIVENGWRNKSADRRP